MAKKLELYSSLWKRIEKGINESLAWIDRSFSDDERKRNFKE